MRYYYSLMQKIKELTLNKYKSKGKVLMFHQVDNNKLNWVDKRFSVSFDYFKKIIIYLQSEGRNFCSVEKIYQGNTDENTIILTFDDGYSDIYTTVYPFLARRGIPFCVFIVTKFIDKEKYLSSDQIKILAQEPLCTIGSHTLSHPLLRFEGDNNALKEIRDSKQILEQLTNRDINYLAYPYGSIYACSSRDRKLAHNAGYIMAFSTLNSHLSIEALEDKFFIPRINFSEKVL